MKKAETTDSFQRDAAMPSAYNTMIKERLCAWQTAFEQANGVKLNYSQIAKNMVDIFHIQTSSQKVRLMFDKQDTREVKLQELAALAQMFHFSLSDICQYPNAPSHYDLDVLTRSNKAHRLSVEQLHNDFYEGLYYCYYFYPKYFDRLKPIQNNSLREATLEIHIEKGHTTVTLQEISSSKTFDGAPMPAFTLTGNLYHFINTDIAYSFISDQEGRRGMALMFRYLNLSADIRFYIPMGMLAFSVNQTHIPIFQKMAVFRVRQNIADPETDALLRGILALNSTPIIIEESEFQSLLEEDPQFELCIPSEKDKKRCLVFYETALKNSLGALENDKIERMIFKLREKSLLPSQEIIDENEDFTSFIKAYQQMYREREHIFQR